MFQEYNMDKGYIEWFAIVDRDADLDFKDIVTEPSPQEITFISFI